MKFKEIDQLSPDDFECFVLTCLENAGWSDLRRTLVGIDSRYGDGGYDIEGYRDKKKWLFEVKQRSNSPVGISALRQIKYAGDMKNVTNLGLVTNNYFTEKVQDDAAKLGVELIDRNKLLDIFLEKKTDIGKSITLRGYQRKIIDEVMCKIENESVDKFLIEMATGLGKTVTSVSIVKLYLQNKKISTPKVLFIAHQKEILKQSRLAYKAILGISKYSYSVLYDGDNLGDQDFIFASFQTLLTQKNKRNKNYYDIIIVDECHHFPAKTFSMLKDMYTPRLLLGLSATIERADGLNVVDYFGGENGRVGKLDLIWALKNRILALPRYHLLTDDIDEDKLRELKATANIKEIDRTIFLEKKEDEIIKIINDYIIKQQISSPKAIVFCKSIVHIKYLLNFFEPGTATFVYSGMDQSIKSENIKKFREGKYQYILVRDIFNEGVDIPEVNILVFLRKTTSKVIWLQQLGRGLRKTEIKKHVDVFDFVGSIERIKQVENLLKKTTKKNIIVENEQKEVICKKNEIIYDNSFIVNYSKAAAEIGKLIEKLEFKTKTKKECIDEIYRIERKIGHKPTHNELMSEIEEVSYDQLVTIFNDYRNLILEVYEEEDVLAILRNIEVKIENKIDELLSINNLFPSLALVDVSLQVDSFPLTSNEQFNEIISRKRPMGIEKEVKNCVENKNILSISLSRREEIINYCRKKKLTKKSFEELSLKEQEEIRNLFPILDLFFLELES